jgi:hypothetical protein
MRSLEVELMKGFDQPSCCLLKRAQRGSVFFLLVGMRWSWERPLFGAEEGVELGGRDEEVGLGGLKERERERKRDFERWVRAGFVEACPAVIASSDLDSVVAFACRSSSRLQVSLTLSFSSFSKIRSSPPSTGFRLEFFEP